MISQTNGSQFSELGDRYCRCLLYFFCLFSPSSNWLGRYSSTMKIKTGKLWLSQHINTIGLTVEKMDKIKNDIENAYSEGKIKEIISVRIAAKYFLGFYLNLVSFLIYCPKDLLTFCQICQEHLK